MTDDTELLVGHKSIAIFLGLSPRQVSWHDEHGRLPTFRMGKSVCARKSTLRQWLEQMEQNGLETKAKT